MSGHAQDDDLPDPRLRTALDHAPDHAVQPPSALREAVLRSAHANAPAPARVAAARVRPAKPWWQRLLAPGPGALAAVAGAATLGLAINLAWRVSNEPSAALDAPPSDAAVIAMRQTPPASATQAPAEQATAQQAPKQNSERFTPPVETMRRSSPRLADAAPPVAEQDEARESRAKSANAAPAPAPAREPPADAVADLRLLEAQRAPEAAAPVTPSAAPMAPAARSPLAAAKPMPRQEVAGLAAGQLAPWPAPLMRWTQALAASGAGLDAPAGWQVIAPTTQRASAPAGPLPAAWRPWWQALLEGTRGHWQVQAPTTPMASAVSAWRVSAPDGALFTLWVDAEAVWLQAGSETWRAPHPAGLTSAP